MHPKNPHGVHNTEWFYASAIRHRTKGDFQSAIKEYTRAVELDRKDFKTRFNLAYAHFQVGNYKDAIKHYVLALKLEPYNVHLLFNLANCLCSVGLFKHAVTYYSNAIELSPRLSTLYRSRALAYRAFFHLF